MDSAILLKDLEFTYQHQPSDGPALFRGFSLSIQAGARCLLLGQNGVGKTTLLRIIGGKHMVPEHAVRVLGASAFHATDLATRVAFLGGPFPFDVDMSVQEILAQRFTTPLWSTAPEALSVRARRRDRLMDLLDIQPAWRMRRLSAGQRRRVQILLGLLDPVEVVLLDEVTADLDVLARADLLGFLGEETAARGTTVVYATHVLDGLSLWATHLCFLSPGPRNQDAGTRLRVMAPLHEVPEFEALRRAGAPTPLLSLCERWLREDREALREASGRAPAAPSGRESGG